MDAAGTERQFREGWQNEIAEALKFVAEEINNFDEWESVVGESSYRIVRSAKGFQLWEVVIAEVGEQVVTCIAL